ANTSLLFPSIRFDKSNIRCANPPVNIKSPAKIKNGIAIKADTSTPENSVCIIIVGGVPLTKIYKIEDNPKVTAIGTPKKSSKIALPKNKIITLYPLLHVCYSVL